MSRYSIGLTSCLLLVPIILGFSGCGSDKPKNTGSGNTSKSSVTMSSALSKTSTSSQTMSSGSSVSTVIKNTKVSGLVDFKKEDGSSVVLDKPETVSIRISLLNVKNEVLKSATTQLVNLPTTIDKSHVFEDELLNDGGSYIVVNIAKEGFTDYARRFDLESEVNVHAILSELPSKQIMPTQAMTISGKMVDGFNFSVNGTGTLDETTVNGSLPELSVSIPKSAMPQGTTSVDVKMQAFNPNDEKDAEYFPGAYEDSKGNKLLSVAFNYTEVTTNTGVPLKQLAEASRKLKMSNQKMSAEQKAAIAEPIIINRLIPKASCSALKQIGDADKTMAGFQVPVYTYNSASGLWDLLGQGTLYSSTGDLITDDVAAIDCEKMTYVIEVKVTNEIFLSNWWNLDYPLVFSQPVKLCANVKVVDQASAPISGSIAFVKDDDEERSFSAQAFLTDEMGLIQVELYSLENPVVDKTAKLTLYSSSFGSNVSHDLLLSTESCTNVAPVVIKTEFPGLCKVEGKVTDKAGKPLTNSLVIAGNFAEQENPVLPAVGTTNDMGVYNVEVSCKQDYGVFSYLNLLSIGLNNLGGEIDFTKISVNVNSTVGNEEITDDGKKATLKDIVIADSIPFAFVGNDETTKDKLTLFFYYLGSSYPLTYSFNVVDAMGATLKTVSGTIKKEDILPSENFGGSVLIDFVMPSLPSPATLLVEGEISDASGGKGKVSGFVNIGN
jgi:hypothetical protein